jgi:hypothetical protein
MKPKAKTTDAVVQKTENELLIYNLSTNNAYCLNETSALVWELCDGKRTVEDIINEMSSKLKTAISKDFVRLAIDQLANDDLLENSDETGSNFTRVSRRDVIRKVGFASMIALPLVSAVVAPNAMNAASLLVTTAMCTTDSECASGNCISDGGGPPFCCEPGVVGGPTGEAAAPLLFITVNSDVCTTNSAGCVTTGAMVCCSGGASLQPPGGFTCPFGEFGCQCNA